MGFYAGGLALLNFGIMGWALATMLGGNGNWILIGTAITAGFFMLAHGIEVAGKQRAGTDEALWAAICITMWFQLFFVPGTFVHGGDGTTALLPYALWIAAAIGCTYYYRKQFK